MMLPVRDVRTVERAGALIAGSDDADSLWLDPAGPANLAGDGRTRIDRGRNRLSAVSNQQSGSPYAGLHRDDDDSPQRYASVHLAGSTDRSRIGATVTDVVSWVVARLVVSGVPG
jgi:hypothetical protein